MLGFTCRTGRHRNLHVPRDANTPGRRDLRHADGSHHRPVSRPVRPIRLMEEGSRNTKIGLAALCLGLILWGLTDVRQRADFDPALAAQDPTLG